ncbi:class I SAM-dependent methyltransferase [Conexibacter sp. DBS9H8]|uniref:class I SAM-dependent methyltransferase n=1 Tax=Conexibacter sp. DBS9H8 TaxID=2937801 RepID=UPI00200E3272|nr:class I SAM-dependent methyltransferase [Conexibacter sp. DBS9H8]
MDCVERLTFEAAQEDTMLAAEHRHRYRFAAGFAAGQTVLDLCCGSGYGSAILAETAAEVTGVDADVATIETARRTVAATRPNVRFEAADALAYLRGPAAAAVPELIVCFEGLEHLPDLDATLTVLGHRAQDGARLLLSVPNDRLTGVTNPFHVTVFGYDEARELAARFPGAELLPQFLAEGSLIAPPGADGVTVTLAGAPAPEPAYANHFLITVGFSAAEVSAAVHGEMSLAANPIFNRWSEGLKLGVWGLRRENARLARRHLGQGGSAAAAAVARQAELEERVRGLSHELRVAQERAAQLELQHAAAAGAAAFGTGLPPEAALETAILATPARGLALAAGEDPNSWESRRRRAEGFLLPWIAKNVELDGATVLEYGCGNGPVACAFAPRVRRHIGVDIDADAVSEGRAHVQQRGLTNLELAHHPLEQILEAVAAHRGEVDVFLLYAVLEHLTPQERVAVLTLARDVVRPGGVIVVAETPNRLISFDHHTGQIPYLHMLPAEVALAYARHSPRRDFTDAISAAAAEGPAEAAEALTRWGRGVSFHEFELVFGDLAGHVIASSYDPLLFGERPVHADDVTLSRYLGRMRPDLAPNWSRYWLDVILTPAPRERRPPLLTPWVADTCASTAVGWSAEERLILTRPGAELVIDLPAPTERIVLGSVTSHGDPVILTVRTLAGDCQVIHHREGPGGHAYSSVTVAPGTRRVSVQSSGVCELVFVGYER